MADQGHNGSASAPAGTPGSAGVQLPVGQLLNPGLQLYQTATSSRGTPLYADELRAELFQAALANPRPESAACGPELAAPAPPARAGAEDADADEGIPFCIRQVFQFANAKLHGMGSN